MTDQLPVVDLSDEELNRLCATRIMGWAVGGYKTKNYAGFEYQGDGWVPVAYYKSNDFLPVNFVMDINRWSPLTDPAHNEMVLDRLKKTDNIHRIYIFWDENDVDDDEQAEDWGCEIEYWDINDSSEHIKERNRDRKRAIVLSALKAKGVIQ